jgi:hypothetical protein
VARARRASSEKQRNRADLRNPHTEANALGPLRQLNAQVPAAVIPKNVQPQSKQIAWTDPNTGGRSDRRLRARRCYSLSGHRLVVAGRASRAAIESNDGMPLPAAILIEVRRVFSVAWIALHCCRIGGSALCLSATDARGLLLCVLCR